MRRSVGVLSAAAVFFAVTMSGGVASAQSSSAAATPSTSPAAPSTSATTGTSASSSTTSGTSATSSTDESAAECPKLMVYAMQGTGQSSPDASETTDSGELGKILGPLMQKFAGQGVIDRKYVPYEAGFGGAVPGGDAPYSRSVTGGEEKMSEMVAADAQRCPDMLIAALGYSQGAGGTRMMLNNIAEGSGPVDPDRVAMGTTFADPGRGEGAPVLPGAENQSNPEPPPGMDAPTVEAVDLEAAGDPPEGGGVGPQADQSQDFGSMSGRVASWCDVGDLACDVPEGAPIARVMANLAGQSELNPDDPVGSLSTVADALASTTIKTGTAMVNEDISGESLTDLDYEPKKTISERMESASDPRSEAGDAGAALQKLGTIGLNSMVAVAKKVITPQNIAELATVGLASPQAALGLLVGRVGEAVVDLAAPTVTRMSGKVIEVIEQEVEANKELPAMVADVNYWKAAQAHGSYFNTPSTATGSTAAEVTTQWLTALAEDLGGTAGEATSGSSSAVATSTGATAPSSPSSVLTVAPVPVGTSPSATSSAAATSSSTQ